MNRNNKNGSPIHAMGNRGQGEKKRYADSGLRHCEEFYDRYAGAVYGAILRMAGNEAVAQKVLVKAFRNALIEKNIDAPSGLSEFTCLSNHARRKTLDMLKAIELFRACNAGIACKALP